MTTKEQVIELAKQAGFDVARALGLKQSVSPDIFAANVCITKELETYTRLVRESYRAELLAGSGDADIRGQIRVPIAGGYSDWIEIHLADVDRPYREGVETRRIYQLTPDQQAAAVLKARNQALEDAAQKCVASELIDMPTRPEIATVRKCAAAIRNMKDNT